MELGIAVIGTISAVLLGLERVLKGEMSRAWIVFAIAIVAVNGGLHWVQYYNVTYTTLNKQKTLERELAFSLWAYTSREERALKHLTSRNAASTHSYLRGYYYFTQGSQDPAKQAGNYNIAEQALLQAIDQQEFVAPSNYILAVISQKRNEGLAKINELLKAGMTYDSKFSSLYVLRAIVRAIQRDIIPALDDIENAVRLSLVHCYTVLRNGPDPNHPLNALKDETRFKKLMDKCKDYESQL